jgi:hypothetical protein
VRTESRQNRIVTSNDLFKLGAIQEISLLDGDAVPERPSRSDDGETMSMAVSRDPVEGVVRVSGVYTS